MIGRKSPLINGLVWRFYKSHTGCHPRFATTDSGSESRETTSVLQNLTFWYMCTPTTPSCWPWAHPLKNTILTTRSKESLHFRQQTTNVDMNFTPYLPTDETEVSETLENSKPSKYYRYLWSHHESKILISPRICGGSWDSMPLAYVTHVPVCVIQELIKKWVMMSATTF